MVGGETRFVVTAVVVGVIVVVGVDSAKECGARVFLQLCQKLKRTDWIFIKFMIQGMKPLIIGKCSSQGVNARPVVFDLIGVH